MILLFFVNIGVISSDDLSMYCWFRYVIVGLFGNFSIIGCSRGMLVVVVLSFCWKRYGIRCILRCVNCFVIFMVFLLNVYGIWYEFELWKCECDLSSLKVV